MYSPLVALALAFAVHDAGTQPPAAIYGTYSRFEVDQTLVGSGDIGGFELVVLPGVEHPYIVFQCAAGDVQEPVLVPAKVDGGGLIFDVPEQGSCAGHYMAKLVSTGLELSFTGNGPKPVLLLRGKSRWFPRLPAPENRR